METVNTLKISTAAAAGLHLCTDAYTLTGSYKRMNVTLHANDVKQSQSLFYSNVCVRTKSSQNHLTN